tara:strand:+ start:614 stop:814 length:201 start_codon:yes stop_codon:yes gene_type:complete
MGKVKDLYMDIESSASDYLDNYLNDENLNLQECRDKFEAEHGWSALHIFDEVFEGAEILKLNGHKW